VSEQNVERARRVLDLFNARDIDAMLAYCDPSIEFHVMFEAVGGSTTGMMGCAGGTATSRRHWEMRFAWSLRHCSISAS